MAVNKVVYGDEVKIDLTGDSVTPETLQKGVTAHNAAGDKIVGTMVVQELDILATKEELEANTEPGKVVDALVVKDINSSFAYDENGIYGYRRKVDGADTVIPFSNRIKLIGAKYNIYITSSDNNRNVIVNVLKDGYVQLCCVPITGGSSLVYSDYYACLYVNQVIQENILTDSNMCCSDIAEVKSGDILTLFLPAFFTSKGQTKGYLIYTEGVI